MDARLDLARGSARGNRLARARRSDRSFVSGEAVLSRPGCNAEGEGLHDAPTMDQPS